MTQRTMRKHTAADQPFTKCGGCVDLVTASVTEERVKRATEYRQKQPGHGHKANGYGFHKGVMVFECDIPACGALCMIAPISDSQAIAADYATMRERINEVSKDRPA